VKDIYFFNGDLRKELFPS